ncbi:MAG: TonB-dependent receptor [Cyclobacteriaceae bacterium]|nr:TonB-dependent receptor [Cyclobacteriaceae bacterium]MCH8517861.1 TonB-dependent receptor [Cyclobacteriaceae bacterium]
MKKVILLAFGFLFGITAISYAQTRTVTGTVTSDDSPEGLPGVSVQVKGTGIGTTTNLDGEYSLRVDDSDVVLVFSFIGYTREEVVVGNRSVIDMVMVPDVQTLSEVVVVGFGEQSRRKLTGSVATVSGDQIKEFSAVNFENAIQGRQAGVQVNAASGLLGAPVTVRVRGNSSISGSNQPLFVIDGIPISSNNTGSALGGPGTNSLSNLNPNDIESIEVLKDASAAAIYGARGSNGVVLITTKRGKEGKPTIQIDTQVGVNSATNLLDMMNGEEYTRVMNYSFNRAGFGEDFLGNPADAANTNWLDLVTRDGIFHETNASISGGDSNTKYFASITYRDEEGYIQGNNLERFNTRLNLDQKINDRARMGISINASRSINERVGQDNAVLAPLTYGTLMFPNVIKRNPDGSPNTSIAPNPAPQFNGNPLTNLEGNRFETTINQIIGTTYLEYDILPNLVFRTEMGVDVFQIQEINREGSLTTGGFANRGQGLASNVQRMNWNSNTTLSYIKELGRGELTATLGMQIQEEVLTSQNVFGNQFPSDDLPTLASAAEITGGTSSITSFAFDAYFTRLNYSIDDKYIFQVTGRYEGSSRFGSDVRYGFFPSASGAWIISDEAFMAASPFSFLKLRSSIGITGNADGIGNFPALGLASAGFNFNLIPGFAPAQLANENLQWETTRMTDIAVEYGFFNNRLRGSVGFFDNFTSDLLLATPIPATSGFTTFTENTASVSNRGIEIDLSFAAIEGNNFSWNTSFNATWLRNNVESLGGNEDIITGANIVREGHPLGAHFLVEYAGVDPANGDALFFDLEGNVTNQHSLANRQVLGNPFPEWFGGFNNNFQYKNWSLDVLFTYETGHDIYNAGGPFSQSNGTSIWNLERSQLNHWTPENTITDVPEPRFQANNGQQASSRFLEDGSFLRLRNVTLARNFQLGNTNLRAYVSGQNLLTFTNFTGFDPEASQFAQVGIQQGVQFFTPPLARMVMGGINLTF